MSTHEERDRRRDRRRTWLLQLGAYVLIVAIGAFGFWQADQAREDARRRAAEHRQVTANVVCAVAQLIRDLVTPAPGQKLTERQQAYIASTLRRLHTFERDQLDQLGKKCEPIPQQKPQKGKP